jgi:hypothetical protein
MIQTVHVEAARIPDRNRLLADLREAGLDARPVGEVEIEVPLEGTVEEADEVVIAHAESVIMRTGAPFVPIQYEGTIYIRPPTN